MNRKIKFRAYHSVGEQKQMTDGVQPLAESLTIESDKVFCMVPMQGIVFHEPTGRKRYWYEIEVDAIMQFTGLKDKNGREIYEGDIVKLHDHPTGIDDCESKVIFSEGAFIADYNGLRISDYGTAWTEVIGNIYEA